MRSEELFNSAERQNSENIWKEIAEFTLNNQYTFSNSNVASQTDISSLHSTNAGSKRTRRVFDSTALQAVQDLAAAFQGTLTNPATVWSKLRFQEDELNNDEEATMWLEKVNAKIHNEFNESNFDTEMAKCYQSFVSMANMALFHELNEDDKDFFSGLRFTSLHLSELMWAEDKNGTVDTIFRKFQMTARQMFEKWGNKVSDDVIKALTNNPDLSFEILHAIFPRDKKKVKLNELGLADGTKRPFASFYIEMNKKNVLSESGYYEFPIHVGRWSLMPGERFGRGPGHLAIPDIRSLNKLMQLNLEALAKDINPPLLAQQRDVLGQLDLRPKSISVVRDVNGFKELNSQARTDRVETSIVRLKESVRSIFFLDKLLLPNRQDTGEMTAFEISQRIEQMHRVLGPTLSRINSEVLQPLVVRAFKIMLRAGALPAMPDILKEKGVDIEIVFVNQLARAQQIQDVSNIQQWVVNLSQLAQINPQVVDNIDVDGIARHTAKILGVPEVAIMNSKEVEQIRQARQQAMQQAQQLEALNKGADAAAKLGNLEE